MQNSYTTLTEVKDFLGISWTCEDELLILLLQQSYSLLNKMLDIESFNQSTYEEYYNYCKIDFDWVLYLKNYPINSITEINSKTYTWVLWTDYLIVLDRKIIINNLFDYLIDLNFDYFKIQYNAWYDRDFIDWQPWPNDELPKDIKMLQMLLIAWLRNKWKYAWIKSYKLWEEQITFWSTDWDSEIKYLTFMNLFNKYKKANVL